MSRQNKNKRVINQRKQVTKVHQAGVKSFEVLNKGLCSKRTKQQKEARHSVGLTKKLLSFRKGRCIVKEGKRISADV